jgi:hypothetical protein
MPAFKGFQDRLTHLLGANAVGDFKLEPMLYLYHSENPRALRIILKPLCLCFIIRTRKPGEEYMCLQHDLLNNLSPLLRLLRKKDYCGWALVAHACNTSSSGGRDKKNHGLKPVQANS